MNLTNDSIVSYQIRERGGWATAGFLRFEDAKAACRKATGRTRAVAENNEIVARSRQEQRSYLIERSKHLAEVARLQRIADREGVVGF